jgi:hypothetical protein
MESFFLTPSSASNLSEAVLQRDNGCKITAYHDYVNTAYICPRNKDTWFESNAIGEYNINQSLENYILYDDISNTISLRSDLHKAFDDTKFVIVPKHGAWFVHFMDFTYNLGPYFHNTVVSLDRSVSIQFLLVRFAWTIFPFLRHFVRMGISRKLRIQVEEMGQYKEVIKVCSGDEVKALYAATQGGSGSPKKRKAANGTSD